MDARSSWPTLLFRTLFYALMIAGLGLMLEASLSYLELGGAHPFLLEKFPLAHPRLFEAALYAHVPAALFALPACLVLSSHGLRRRFPRVHRWLGRGTTVLIVGCVVPTGLYLAPFARGGVWATFGFWLSGLITFAAMVESVRSARQRDVRGHRRFSAHVTAQLSVAVTSRFLLVALESLELTSDAVYAAALWGPVLGSALLAEWLTGPRFSLAKGTHHETSPVVVSLDDVRARRAGRASAGRHRSGERPRRSGAGHTARALGEDA